MDIQSIHITFNQPGAYDMIRLRLWIRGEPLSVSLFMRDWQDVIDFLGIADNDYVAINLGGWETNYENQIDIMRHL